MKTPSSHDYIFGDFHFDANRLALHHTGQLVKGVEKKALEVLAALLRKPNELVTHDEIIQHVWHDNPHGVTPVRVNQYVSKIQKAFALYDPESKLIENLKGRGYIFVGEVANTTAGVKPNESLGFDQSSAAHEENPVKHFSTSAAQTSQRTPQEHIYLIAGLGVLAIIILSAWMVYKGDDAEDVKRVVKDSQMYESLVLYKKPDSFKEGDLDRFWTTELDLNSNYDRARIRESVEKLRNEGKRYGDETECEQFEFQTLDINAANDMAVVKTLEKWFVAVYGPDGKLIKNKYVGPYFVSYILRKVDGRWLIEKSNTARATPVTPKLTSVEPIGEVASGRPFLLRITGEDFLPEIVLIRVVGEGCPESNPCTVPNNTLRTNATISPTRLEKVQLTLSSGEFQLYAANGDSPNSNPLPLKVPNADN